MNIIKIITPTKRAKCKGSFCCKINGGIMWRSVLKLSNVNDWVIVVLHQVKQFFIISWKEQVTFRWDDDEVRFVLDQHIWLDFYSANSLRQHSADRHVAPLGHIIPIPRQPAFALSP
jgi:hypothetical protein